MKRGAVKNVIFENTNTADASASAGIRWMPRSRFASLMAAVLLVAMPAMAQEQDLPTNSVQVPTTPDCANCVSTTTGRVVIHYAWSANGLSSTTEGSAPNDATVRFVYLTGAPTGSYVTISRIKLQHGIAWDNIFYVAPNGAYVYPEQGFAKAYPWQGQRVNEGSWDATPTFTSRLQGWNLQMHLVIEWEAPAPDLRPVGAFERMSLTGQFESYAYDKNDQSRTVQGRVTWDPPSASGVHESQISFSQARPSLNSRLGIQGNHAFDPAVTPSSLLADGVKRTFRLYAKSVDGTEYELPGSPKVGCFQPAAKTLASGSVVPCDGTLLRGPEGGLYVMAGGAPFLFVNDAEAQALGYNLANVVPDNERLYEATFGSLVRNGTLYRFGGSDARFVVAGSGLFWAPSSASWEAYKTAVGKTEAHVVVMPRRLMQTSVPTPRDGTVVREVGKDAIWVYRGGGRFWATSWDAWTSYAAEPGVTDTTIQPIPFGALSAMIVNANGVDEYRLRNELTPGDGTLVREVGKPAVWVYQGGGRFWAPSSAALDAYRATSSTPAIHPIPLGSLSAYLAADANYQDSYRLREDTRPRDGTLVREMNSTQTWVYQGGGSFLFPSDTEFSLWPGPKDVRAVPAGSLSALLVGEPSANYQDQYRVRDDLPADGTLLRERTGTQVYQVTGQQKFPASGYDPAQVKVVPDSSVQRVPNG
jgi:hypothetical protein